MRGGNYYEVLGLHPQCSREEIVQAFRHLVKKFHPDSAIEPDLGSFQQLMEAYSVLRGAESRKSYDSSLSMSASVTAQVMIIPKQRVSYAFSIHDLARQGLLRKRLRRGDIYTQTQKNYDITIQLHPDEILGKVVVKLDLPIRKRCFQCEGDQTWSSVCPVCEGSGQVTEMRETLIALPSGLQSGSILRVDLRRVHPGGLAYFRSRQLRVRILL